MFTRFHMAIVTIFVTCCALFAGPVMALPLWMATFNGSQQYAPYDGQKYFDQVQKIIAQNQVTSIAQLIPLLPDDLRSRHVLLFDSRSLQEGSYRNPRILLISPHAEFIMTFNGDVSQKGFESLETMRYLEADGHPRFVFEELLLAQDLQARAEYLQSRFLTDDLTALLDRANLKGPNPTGCVNCHRANSRPNWASYPEWLGAYGQFDDLVKRALVFGQDNSEAVRQLPVFLASAASNPRYQNIKYLDEHSAPRLSSHRSNLASLSLELGQLNFRRIRYLMEQSPNFKTERLLIMLAGFECNLEKVGAQMGFTNAKQFDLSIHSSSLSFDRLAFIFQKSALPWQDFYMDLLPSPANSLASPIRNEQELAYALVHDDPSLSSMFKLEKLSHEYLLELGDGRRAYAPNDICEKLSARLQK